MAGLDHGWLSDEQRDALVQWARDQWLYPEDIVRGTLSVRCGVVYGRKFVFDDTGVPRVRDGKPVTKRFWRIQRTRLPRDWKWY